MSVTGPGDVVTDQMDKTLSRNLLPGFQPDAGTRLVRMRCELVTGHRFQRLDTDG